MARIIIMKNIFKIFKRKITVEYIKKHFTESFESFYPAFVIGTIDSDYGELLAIEIRDDRFCLVRGYSVSSYWLIDVEYVSDLKRLIKLYKVKK